MMSQGMPAGRSSRGTDRVQLRARRHAAGISIDTVADHARDVIAMAQGVADGPHPPLSVRLPDLSVRVSSFDPDLAVAVARQFVPAPPADGAARMRVFILHPGVAGVGPPLPWDRRRPCHPQRLATVLAQAGLQAAYFDDLEHWHILDHASGVAVQLMRAPGDYPPWETGAPLRPFLHWHYAQAGQRLAHCGTLGVAGRGVVLAGGGGSGKSGTVIAGLMHGLQSVGDDYVLLDGGGTVTARPLFATLKQDPAGFRRLRLGRVLGDDLPLNWQGKHQFTIMDVAPQPVPERLAIGALLVPQVSGAGPSTITPMPRTEAMIALAASSIHQMPGERESGFRFLADITRRLPCYRLALGPDPGEIAARIGAFIATDMP